MRNVHVIGAGIVVCLFAGATIADGASVVDAKAFDRTVVCTFDDVVVTIGAAPKTTLQPGLVFADDAGSMNAGGAVDPRTLPFAGADTDRGAFVNSKRCTRTRIHVPLTRKGLPGPAIAFGAVARCLASHRVLFRLRYTYTPGTRAAGYDVGGKLISAFLAARTYRTGKPLAFARLTAGGNKAQLYSAASCTT